MGCDGGNCGGSPSVIFGYVGTAILLKFLSGIDDVVWLAPFMAREVSHGRLVIAVKYVLINFTICGIAVALASIVHVSIHHGAKSAEDLADKIIACFASALLLLYAYYIAKQDGVCGELEESDDPPDKSEYTPLHEVEDEEDPFAAGPRRRSATGLDAGSPTGSVDLDDEADDLGCHERLVVGCLSSGLEPSSPGKDEARRRFVIVAVLGNLDDFLMYFSIVVSLHFCWWEFILGTTIGAICIATALGTCLWCSPRLADKVASLPLVPVVVIMAIYIAVQAFVPAMNPSPRNSAGAC